MLEGYTNHQLKKEHFNKVSNVKAIFLFHKAIANSTIME